MNTIRRYKNRMTPDGDHLTESPDGDWVDYADHEYIVRNFADHNAELLAALERTTDVLAKVMACPAMNLESDDGLDHAAAMAGAAMVSLARAAIAKATQP